MGEFDFMQEYLWGKELKEIEIPKDSPLIPLFEHIQFITQKLEYLIKEINKEYEKLCFDITEQAKKQMEEQRKIMSEQDSTLKNNSNEVTLTIVFKYMVLKNPLMFHIDTFLADTKRLIEFALKFIGISQNINMDDFSLDNFMKHINKENPKEQPSNFALYLMKKRPTFTECLLNNYKGIIGINYKRTRVTHFEVFNKIEDFKAEFEWNSVQSLKDNPSINRPLLKLFNKPIPQFIDEEMQIVRKVITCAFRTDYPLFKTLAKDLPSFKKNSLL